MRLALLPVAAALFAACAHAPARGPRLARATAEGWAPIVRSDPVGTRRRSLAEALRAAAEKAAGVRVSGSTKVSQAIAIDDSIMTRSLGEVRSYEILGESEEDGFHKTRVRVLVEIGAPPTDGDRPGPPPGDPKVAVRLNGPQAVGAAAAVRRGLIERGFTVIEGSGAQITVSGDVAVIPIGTVGPWRSSRARVTLEAREEKTGRILWSASREASGIGAVIAGADLKASEEAGLLGGEDLARDVAARLAD
ncbi:MAG: hypothetical protein ACHQ49_16280 [Elusimicrobiota bacterium]